jgi:hypothetical protein
MESIKLNVFNIVGDSYCMEAEDGQKLFEMISKGISEKRKVVVSFENVKMQTTAFLNTAIGQLYKDYSEAEVRAYLELKDMSQAGLISLKRVVDTAKLYYKDPDALKRSIDEIMGE